MNRRLLELYGRLRGPLQNAAAGLHGCRLNAWRYGPDTGELRRREVFVAESVLTHALWASPDGRPIGRLDPAFRDGSPLRQEALCSSR